MAVVAFSPIGNGFQFLTPAGLPLSGGLLFTYAAGTSTPQATYTTSAGTITNSNPIVLGSDGRPPAEIWLVSGSAYKFVLTDSLSNPIAGYDNISGINDFNSLTLAGNLTVNGNTVLGAGPGNTLLINPSAVSWPNNPTHSGNHAFSQGIAVGNTPRAGANIFDWYDKNTFTPGLTFGGASVGMTYSFQAGTYNRVGNRVHVQLDVLLTNKGSSTGAAKITGLPYPVNSSVSMQTMCWPTALAAAAANTIYVLSPDPGANTCSVLTFDITGVTGAFTATNAAFTNTSRLQAEFAYQV